MRLVTIALLAPLTAALLLATGARADDPAPATPQPEAPTPAAPAPGADPAAVEAQAVQLIAAAKERASRSAHAGVESLVDQLLASYGTTAAVKAEQAALEALRKDAREALAKDHLDKLGKLAPKNPEKARASLEALEQKYADTDLAKEKQAEIAKLGTAVRTALWGGAGRYQGAATVPAEGRLRLEHPFDRTTELGDFAVVDPKKAPKIEKGALVFAARGAAVRHPLEVAAGDFLTVEVELGGQGDLFIYFGGTDAEAGADEPGVRIELRAKSLVVAPIHGKKDAGKPFDAPRAEGAATLRLSRDPEGVTVRLMAGEEAKAEERFALTAAGAAKVGLVGDDAKLSVLRLMVEAPLQGGGGGEGGLAGGPAAKELPRGVFIPLFERGLEGWKERGGHRVKDGIIEQPGGGCDISYMGVVGVAMDRYTLTVDVRLDLPANLRGGQEPFFAVAFPNGDGAGGWVFTGRGSYLDGADEMRNQTLLAPDQWTTLSIRRDGKLVELSLGGKRVIAAKVEDVPDARKRFDGQSPLAFIGLANRRRVAFKDARLKLEP